MSKKTQKYFLGIGPWQILAMLLIGLGFLCFFAGRWYLETYGELGLYFYGTNASGLAIHYACAKNG